MKKIRQANFRNAKGKMMEIIIESGFCNTKAEYIHVWFFFLLGDTLIHKAIDTRLHCGEYYDPGQWEYTRSLL